MASLRDQKRRLSWTSISLPPNGYILSTERLVSDSSTLRLVALMLGLGQLYLFGAMGQKPHDCLSQTPSFKGMTLWGGANVLPENLFVVR